MMGSAFKKRAVSAERAAAVELATVGAPIVGDPRMQIDTPMEEASVTHLGSSQFEIKGHTIYEVGKVYDVPLEFIKSNPVNPRAVYSNSAVDEMAISLSSNGQRISATGYVGSNGSEIFLIEGETRLRGARVAVLPTLRIEIKPRPDNERELYEEARAANVERREQTPLDDAIRWKELLGKKIYPTQSALAKALNLGEDYVSRTLSLATLPSRIIHALVDTPELLTHKMLNALREFWEVRGDDETLELILDAAKNSLGYRDVLARRKAAVRGPIKRPRSTKEALFYQGAKGELKSFEEEGRVELSLKGLTPDASESIITTLRGLFANKI